MKEVLRDDGGVYTVTFGDRVTVSSLVNMRDMRWMPCVITWSASGAQSVQKTRAFIECLTNAIEHAEAIDADRAGKPYKEPT